MSASVVSASLGRRVSPAAGGLLPARTATGLAAVTLVATILALALASPAFATSVTWTSARDFDGGRGAIVGGAALTFPHLTWTGPGGLLRLAPAGAPDWGGAAATLGLPWEPLQAFPAVGDLDGDGLEDLLVGLYDGDSRTIDPVLAYRNEGAPGRPEWVREPAWEVADTDGDPQTPPLALSSDYPVPALGDVDDDGDLDLALGSAAGLPTFYSFAAAQKDDPVWTAEPYWNGGLAGSVPAGPLAPAFAEVRRRSGGERVADLFLCGRDAWAGTLSVRGYRNLVVEGSKTAWAHESGWDVSGTQRFSRAMAGAADLTGDGLDDLLVSLVDTRGVVESLAFMNRGSGSGPSWVADSSLAPDPGTIAFAAFANLDDDRDWDLVGSSSRVGAGVLATCPNRDAGAAGQTVWVSDVVDATAGGTEPSAVWAGLQVSLRHLGGGAAVQVELRGAETAKGVEDADWVPVTLGDDGSATVPAKVMAPFAQVRVTLAAASGADDPVLEELTLASAARLDVGARLTRVSGKAWAVDVRWVATPGWAYVVVRDDTVLAVTSSDRYRDLPGRRALRAGVTYAVLEFPGETGGGLPLPKGETVAAAREQLAAAPVAGTPVRVGTVHVTAR